MADGPRRSAAARRASLSPYLRRDGGAPRSRRARRGGRRACGARPFRAVAARRTRVRARSEGVRRDRPSGRPLLRVAQDRPRRQPRGGGTLRGETVLAASLPCGGGACKRSGYRRSAEDDAALHRAGLASERTRTAAARRAGQDRHARRAAGDVLSIRPGPPAGAARTAPRRPWIRTEP